jgi:hypothetical protein
MSGKSFEQELIDLERRGWQALSTPDGADHYRGHMADDGLMAFPFGVMDKEQALAGIEDAEPWSTFELSEPRVVALGPDAGVVVYRVHARREGDEPLSAVVSSTFVRRDGDWKLAFHQQSF